MFIKQNPEKVAISRNDFRDTGKAGNVVIHSFMLLLGV
jgi:hypothetical protein